MGRGIGLTAGCLQIDCFDENQTELRVHFTIKLLGNFTGLTIPR